VPKFFAFAHLHGYGTIEPAKTVPATHRLKQQ